MDFLRELYNYSGVLRTMRTGDTLIIFFMIAGYLYIYQGKNEVIKKAVVFPTLFYTIAFLNPLSSYILAFKFGFSTRIQRFFWIFLVALILGYVGMELLETILPIWRKAFFLSFLVIITFFTQNSNEGISYPTENIYKVTDELIAITDLLHELGIEEGQRVFFEDWNLYATAPQYAPSIRQPAAWEDIYNELSIVKQNKESESFQVFLNYVQERGVSYLVLYQDTTIFSEIEEVEYVAETGKFKIYRLKVEQG